MLLLIVKKIKIMSVEEKNHSQQDSGSKEDSEYFRLDRQIVHDFFLSVDSGKKAEGLTEREVSYKKNEVKEEKREDFFLPDSSCD